MKDNTSLRSILIAVILILAGMISPSNGVDDSVRKTPYQILTAIFMVIVSVVSIYLIWTAIENYREVSKTNSKSN